MDNSIFAILDTTVTQSLRQEGFAREVISKVQQLRKQKGLEMMDNIKIHICADAEVTEAVGVHREYIVRETLAVDRLNGAGFAEYDINGHKTGIEIEKTI
jgi:isoleucyl-tRNA synthetase